MADLTPTNPPTIAVPAPPTVAAPAPPPLAATPAGARGKRKERIGEVISNRMAKSIIVRVERRFPHPKFKKVVTGYKKFCAHDERGEAKVGDRVRIEETRPLSKTKRWRLVAVVEQGAGVARVAA
ncbi:MAG: 30S ribosomal protein S17 [Verrucomicrobiota bacterium]